LMKKIKTRVKKKEAIQFDEFRHFMILALAS